MFALITVCIPLLFTNIYNILPCSFSDRIAWASRLATGTTAAGAVVFPFFSFFSVGFLDMAETQHFLASSKNGNGTPITGVPESNSNTKNGNRPTVPFWDAPPNYVRGDVAATSGTTLSCNSWTDMPLVDASSGFRT